jgi:hypothetical protein
MLPSQSHETSKQRFMHATDTKGSLGPRRDFAAPGGADYYPDLFWQAAATKAESYHYPQLSPMLR